MSGPSLAMVEGWLREASLLRSEPQVLGTPVGGEIAQACIDSRLCAPGSLFVALEGERVDGHDFVDDAVSRGASAVFIREDRLSPVRASVFGSVRLIPVTDPLAALQETGRHWRELYPNLFRVAVTGSNGKTTTKELIAAILSRVQPTIFSRGNYNSDIGLPVELLRIRPEHRYAVFELGMNRPGEIAELTDLYMPDLALVTNVGSAHVGMVGSRRRIAEEKKSIFGRFTGSQTAVVPPSGEFSRFLAADVPATVVRYGKSSAGVTDVENLGAEGSRILLKEGAVHLNLPGEHMVVNAVAAITVARLLEAPFEAIRDGIESVRPTFGRAQVLPGPVTVIQDCYNANPESVSVALGLLSTLPAGGRRVAILGAMKELGSDAPAAHRGVARRAMESGANEVWLVGDEFGPGSSGAGGGEAPAGEVVVRRFSDASWKDLKAAAAELREGDLVLLKGSRTLELERLTPVIQGQATEVARG